MSAGIARKFEEFNRAIEAAEPIEPGLLETFVKTVVNGFGDHRPLTKHASLDHSPANAVASCVEKMVDQMGGQPRAASFRNRSSVRWKASFQREIARLILPIEEFLLIGRTSRGWVQLATATQNRLNSREDCVQKLEDWKDRFLPSTAFSRRSLRHSEGNLDILETRIVDRKTAVELERSASERSDATRTISALQSAVDRLSKELRSAQKPEMRRSDTSNEAFVLDNTSFKRAPEHSESGSIRAIDQNKI